MQPHLLDLLLPAYLAERAASIDASRLTLTTNTVPSRNTLSALENLYAHLQDSCSPTTKDDGAAQQDTHEHVPDKRESELLLISITVCDEAKNLKRQFSCQRTLLIREMRYFADYLKDENDELEEVDISVHCDVDIFQWLMAFVNRHSTSDVPELDPRIAVSILISSDFLKMDQLVVQSLDYIHQHIDDIVATNCNVSCIPDALFRLLAKRFDDPGAIERIHDRKNKIRARLFEYHLEQLLTETKVVRCQFCHTIMTVDQMNSIPCQPDRLVIKNDGKLHFQHRTDTKFDVNLWIQEIHARGEHSWRNTFWLIWLHIHGDQCARCNAYSRFIDFSTCSYHPVTTLTDNKHDCCSKPARTFDILQTNNRHHGCQDRDHVYQTHDHAFELFEQLDKTELIKSHSKSRRASVHTERANATMASIMEQSIYGSTNHPMKKASLHAPWTHLLDAPPCGADLKYAWDATKAVRWNQDIQREDEQRRFEEIVRHLHSMQQSSKATTTRSSKESAASASAAPGGIYCRIENEWRSRPTSTANSSASNSTKTRSRLALK